MLRYIFFRVALLIPTVFLMACVTFIIMQLTPGSPFALGNMDRITPETRARIEAQYGLDDPKVVQFGRYLKNSIQGDFGVSYVWRGQEVSSIIRRTFPVSLQLGFMALIVAVVVGITLGTLAAVNQNGPIDYMSMTTAILFYSMPNFVMGFLLLLLFAVWLPQRGLDLGFSVQGWDKPQDWILPTLALAAAPLATMCAPRAPKDSRSAKSSSSTCSRMR